MVSFKKNIEIIFRFNLGNKVGLGHLYRCLKIANSLKNKKQIIFVIDEKINSKSLLLILKDFKVIYLYKNSEKYKSQLDDASKFNFATQDFNEKFIIVDDYRLSHTWHKKVKKKNNKIVVIDDLLNKKMLCNFYINYKNEKFDKKRINRYLPKKCTKLIGPKYNTLSNKLVKNKKKEYVMINFGNSFNFNNFKNEIHKITNLCKNNKTKLVICIGIYSKNFKFLKKIENYKFVKILHKKFLIEDYLNKTKVFVGSAGSSIYEMSYLNTPSIFLRIAKNQTNNQSDLDELGNFFYFNDIKKKEYFYDLLKVLIKFNSRIRKIKSFKIVKNDGINNILRKINIK